MKKNDDIIKYYPNFIKLEIKNKLLENNTCLLNYYDSPLPNDNFIVYATSVFDNINNIKDIYSFYIQKEDDKLKTFKELSKEYTDLTIDDFDFLIKNRFYNFLILENLPIISDNEKDILKRDIDDYVKNTIKNTWTNNIDFLNDDNNTLKDFYKISYENRLFNYEINEDKTPSFIYTNISFYIKGPSSTKDKFINTQSIFNILELSDDIPFIAYNTSTKKDPVIKIYNKLIDSVKKDIIKSWILNENKKKK